MSAWQAPSRTPCMNVTGATLRIVTWLRPPERGQVRFFYNNVDYRRAQTVRAGAAARVSHLVQGAEDLLGVAGQLLGAVLELQGGLGGAGRAEHVAGGQFPVPAAQPLQALLFFFQLGQGELALGDLGVDLGAELAAVRDELRPLRLPRLGEQG